jgi:hypothetical protein|tara:strand:- start:137 stop:244 length:108 start_codon:yes stop_codon:yes gene_type:complete
LISKPQIPTSASTTAVLCRTATASGNYQYVSLSTY